MLAQFLNYINDQRLFDADSRILLAVSGGVDSVVMAHLFHKANFKFGIAHCNFKLRYEESEGDELFTAQLAEELKAPFYSKTFQTLELSRLSGVSIQMAARELRYQWFEEIRKQHDFDFIATAHHYDDEIETFLINLIRGTGISGLHGIMPKRGHIIRPLMFAMRKEIESYAAENQIKYREDSTNREDKYLRNSIRHNIIPELEKISHDFKEKLHESIGRIREAEVIFDETINQKRNELIRKSGEEFRISIDVLRKLNPPKTWIYELLKDFGCTEAIAGDILLSLDSPPGRHFLFNDYILLKDRTDLIIRKRLDKTSGTEFPHSEEYSITEDIQSIDHPISLTFRTINRGNHSISKEQSIASLDFSKLEFPLVVRRWNKGDFFYPLGMTSRKKLSDFFIDEKYSRFDKDQAWVLSTGGNIAWIIGKRIDNRYKVTDKTKVIYEIKLKA